MATISLASFSGARFKQLITPSISPAISPANYNSSNLHNEGLPKQIGKYRILRMLGSGGFGVVYHGVDDTLNRDVAILGRWISPPFPTVYSNPVARDIVFSLVLCLFAMQAILCSLAWRALAYHPTRTYFRH